MPYDDGGLIASAERFRIKAKGAGRTGAGRLRALCYDRPAGGRLAHRRTRRCGRRRLQIFDFRHPSAAVSTHSSANPLRRFEQIGQRGLIAGIHNENDEMVRAFTAKVEASNITDYRAHGLSRPSITEALATAEVYELGAGAGCPVHIVHSSIGRGYELAAAYRAQGLAATIEACIHYLTLDEEDDVSRLGGRRRSTRRCGRGASGGAVASSRCRQCHRRVDRPCELVGGP